MIAISELECNDEVKWCYVKTLTQLHTELAVNGIVIMQHFNF